MSWDDHVLKLSLMNYKAYQSQTFQFAFVQAMITTEKARRNSMNKNSQLCRQLCDVWSQWQMKMKVVYHQIRVQWKHVHVINKNEMIMFWSLA